jgi:hypothetical protein
VLLEFVGHRLTLSDIAGTKQVGSLWNP